MLEIRTRGLIQGPIYRPLLIAPHGIINPNVNYKITVRSREGHEVLWTRGFTSQHEANVLFCQLIGIEPVPGIKFPTYWIDDDIEFLYATVTTYNSTTNNSGADWSAGGTACPTGVTATDYLVVGAGGGGGNAGGGGAGGYQPGTALAVTAGTNYPVVINAGGAIHTVGGTTTWNTITGNGGGLGANFTAAGGNGGSGGGGAGGNGVTTGLGGTATQGNSGGSGLTDGATFTAGSGGGGAGAVGANAAFQQGGNGGNGTANSISGSSVTYAGGGGGGTNVGTNGTGGTGGGGNAGASATAGTANLGGGGGGGNTTGGAAGGTGVVILSWTSGSVTITYIGSQWDSGSFKTDIVSYH